MPNEDNVPPMGGMNGEGIPPMDADQGAGDVPPMDADQGMDGVPPMDADQESGEVPPMDDGMDQEDDSDKKEIQKATGELSNLLNNYTTPDEELDKYVKGMVDAALDKRKDAGESEEDSLENSPEGQMPEDPQEQMPQMESVRFTKAQMKRLYESLNPVDDEPEKVHTIEKDKKKKSKTPFDAPNFK